MAKFPIQTARQELGFTPSTAVLADIDVRGTGGIGGAIGQAVVAGAELGIKAVKEKSERQKLIEEKDRLMRDRISDTQARKLMTGASDAIAAMKINSKPEEYEANAQKLFTKMREGTSALDLSPDARAQLEAKLDLFETGELGKAFTDKTRKLRSILEATQVDHITELARTGTQKELNQGVLEHLRIMDSLGKDHKLVTANVRAMIEAGRKLRNEDAVEALGNEAAANPAATLTKIQDEQVAREEGKGIIPETELTDKNLISLERYAKQRLAELERDAKAGVEAAQSEEENRLFEGLDDGSSTTADVVGSEILNVVQKRRLLDDESQFVRMDLAKSWPLVDDDTFVQDLNTKLTEQSSGLTDINEMNKFINDAATSGKLTKATRDKMRTQAKKGGLDAIDEQVNASTLRIKNALVGRFTERQARFKVREASRELTRDEQREAQSVGFLLQVNFEQLNRFNAELNKRMRELGKETLSGVEVEALSAEVWEKFKVKDDAQKIREFQEFTGQRVPRPEGFPEDKWNSISSVARADTVAGLAKGMTIQQVVDMVSK